MNLYLIPTFVGALWSLTLGIIVIARGARTRINKVFSFLCFSIFTWLISYTIAYFTKNVEVAAVFCRIACTAVIFVNPLFYDFAVSYLKIDKEKKFVTLSYVITALMTPLFLFTNVFLDTPYKYYWGYYSKAGFYHPFYIVVFFIIFLRAIYLWFRAFLARNNLPPIDRNRLKYLFAVTILIMFAGSDYLQKYGIEIYPFGWVFVVLYSTVAFMAILRYQLLDIEVIIRKTLVFTVLFVTVFGIFIGITLLTQQFIAGSRLLGLAISSIVIILTVRPLENFLVNITNKYLFQKKYDPFQLLKAFSDKVLASALDQAAIVKIAVDLMMKSLNLENFAVLLINKDGDQYQIAGSAGIKNKSI